MCRAECICKLPVYMKTEAAYVPPHPFTEAEVHTLFRQPSARSVQRKGGGISKGGTWVHLFGSVPEARPAQNQRLGKTNEIQTDYPDNIQHYLPPRRESVCTHDRASAGERLREYGCSVTLPKISVKL